MTNMPRLVLLLVLLLPGPASFAARLDADLAAWHLESRPEALRWMPVTVHHGHVSGVLPEYNAVIGQHRVTLAPGEGTQVQVEAGARLLLRRLDGGHAAPWVQISGDANLFRPASLLPTGGRGEVEWLLAETALAPQLVRVTGAAGGDTTVLAMYLSETAGRGEELLQPERLLTVDAASVRLTEGDGLPGMQWFVAEPGTDLAVGVDGLRQLHLHVRLPLDRRLEVDWMADLWADDAYLQTAVHSSPPEEYHAVRVDGVLRTVTREEVLPVALPPGARHFRVRFNRPAWVQLRAGDADDFLWRGNDPFEAAPVADTATQAPAAGTGDAAEPADWPQRERAARLRALARDNGRPDAALQAEAMARNWAAWPGTTTPDRRLLLHAVRNATHWEALRPAPVRSRPLPAGRDVYLARYEVRDELDAVRERVDWSGGAHSLQRPLVGLHVETLPWSRPEALVYQLPERAVASRLLIATDLAAADLSVQFDDAEPIALQLLPHPDHAVAVDAGYLAAAAAHGQTGTDGSAPQWVAGARREPRPLWTAAHAELDLPADVRTVRVWRDAFVAGGAEVGIAFREGHDDRLEETGYRSRLQLAGGAAATRTMFQRAVSDYIDCRDAGRSAEDCVAALRAALAVGEGAAQAAAGQLLNDWLPMLRLLQVRAAQFSAPVTTPFAGEAPGAESAASEPGPATGLADPYVVLQHWQDREEATGVDGGPVAWLQRAGALQALGETYLGRQLLRALVVHAPAGSVAEAAANRLQAELLPEEPLASGLAVTRYRRDMENDGILIGALLAENEPAFAVKAALALGTADAEWTRLGLDYAALAAGWEGPLAQQPGPPAQDGGTAALMPASASLRGRILRWPQETDASQRETLQAWLAWQDGLPGPRVLRNDHAQVTRSAGAEMVTVPDRDLTLELLRAAPGRPLRYEVLGDGLVEIVFRRIVPVEAGPAEHSTLWIRVRSGGEAWRIPLHDAPVSETLGRLADGARVSSARRLRWRLPAGFHVLEIEPETSDVLLQVRSRQPLWQPDFLPRPTPAAVRTVASGAGLLPPVRAGERDETIVLHPLTLPAPTGVAKDPEPAPTVPLATMLPPTAAPMLDLPPAVLQAWSSFAALEEADDPAHAVDIARLAVAHPAEEELQQLERQLAQRGWHWQRGGVILQSAGEWALAQDEWLPASPALRSRALLLPRIAADAEVLTGSDTLQLEIAGSEPGRVRLQVRLRMLPFLPFVPAGVQLDGPGARSRLLELADDRLQTVTLHVPAGPQTIRILPVAFPSNALLEIRAERETATGWTAFTGGRDRVLQAATVADPVIAFLDGPALYRVDRWEQGQLESRYHAVGADGEELVLRPVGTAPQAGFAIRRLAREDREILVAQAAQEAALQPAIEQIAQARESAQPAPPAAVPLLAQPELPASVRLSGPAPGPGLRQGTHAFYLDHRVRLQLDDEGSGGGGESRIPEQEYGVQHFLRDEQRNLYWSSAAFLREPEDGDRVYGLRTGYDQYLPYSPWSHGLDASLHAQDATGDDEWATALLLRGHLDYRQVLSPRHRMRWRLGGFARHLGLDPGEAGALETDPDVYSDFRQDHLHGASAHWYWRYAPWRDGRWEASLASHTNENLDPLHADRQEFELSWSQVVDDWVAGAEYRLRQYNADADRASFARRERIRFSFERDLWAARGDRFSLGLKLDRDLFRDLWTGSLRFTWFPDGDDFHHQAPGSVPFEAFRARQIPAERDDAISAP